MTAYHRSSIAHIPWESLFLGALLGVYVIWAGLFIYQSSFIGIDGRRYFGLFDDAMISMRYAWNFAHGNGLLWNVGQRVEGYSNLLMTLIMALSATLLNKALAVLAIQILGIPTVMLTAWLSRRVALELRPAEEHKAVLGILVMGGVLFYYPLSYWSLMGMETGLLALLVIAQFWFALRWLKTDRGTDLAAMSITAGLAYLTRNDAILLAAAIFCYLGWEIAFNRRRPRTLRNLVYAALLMLLFPVGQTAFRLVYYGQWLPNTFYLKLTGIPLIIRLIGGTRFVLGFFGESWALFLLAIVGLVLNPHPARLCLAAIMVIAIAYQVYAGGDPWPSWRLLAPAIPGAWILAVDGAVASLERISGLVPARHVIAAAASLVLISSLALADQPFLDDMSVRGPTSAAIANRINTNSAIAIDALTSPSASIGVIWAGILPYYADRPAVDFLGKSDAYIAHLSADITGSVSWSGMISVPGHNKYDLQYSIVELKPTYIQAFAWGYQTVKPYVMQHYVRVEYHGAAGTRTILLLKDSPLVCWEACKAQYSLIPWSGIQN